MTPRRRSNADQTWFLMTNGQPMHAHAYRSECIGDLIAKTVPFLPPSPACCIRRFFGWAHCAWSGKVAEMRSLRSSLQSVATKHRW